MENLEEKLKYYADNYYNGNELISDEEYDSLVSQLKKENPNSDFFKDIIGDDLKGITKKVKLPITMGTLAKYHTEKEFAEWFNARKGVELMIQTKMDGNSQCLIYKEGKLIQVISRGNGEYGEDTTENVSKVQGVIKEIPNFTGQIRGEILCKNSVFEKYFKGEKNPRNTAAGRKKKKDGKDCEKLNFVAYEVFEEAGYPGIDTTELKKIEFLKNAGFETPMWWCGAHLEDIFEFRNRLPDYIKEMDYGMDGLVIKYMNTDKEDLKRHIPTTQVAFKNETEVKLTTLRDIKWQLAGSFFSPVAVFDPIELDGATISRASLHNINFMKEKNITIGGKIFVKRSGMVIPKVIGSFD